MKKAFLFALCLILLSGCGESDEKRCIKLQYEAESLEWLIDKTANRSDLTPEAYSSRMEAIPKLIEYYKEMDSIACPHN